MKKRTVRVVIIILILIFLLPVLYYFIFVRNILKEGIEICASPDTLAVSEPENLLYGIPADSFYVEHGRVKRNQNLSEILAKYNLPEGSYNQILNNTEEIFDLRKIRYGNRYTVFLTVDTLYEVRYFVYEHTPVDYILFDFSDSIRVEARKKQVNIIF